MSIAIPLTNAAGLVSFHAPLRSCENLRQYCDGGLYHRRGCCLDLVLIGHRNRHTPGENVTDTLHIVKRVFWNVRWLLMWLPMLGELLMHIPI
jgi:hypothetical protein